MADFQSQVQAAVSAATPDSPSTSSPVETAAPSTSTSVADGSAPNDGAQPEPEAEDFRFPDEEAAPPIEASPEEQNPETPQPGSKEEAIENEKIRKAFMSTERGKRMYRGFQLEQQLLKPPTEGGLGHMPTVEQIREMHENSSHLNLMRHEFHNGNPQYAENFIKNWFQPIDPATGQIGYSPGASQAIGSFIPTLMSMASDPKQPEQFRTAAAEAYRRAALPAMQTHINDMYARGLAEPDLETRIWLLNGARTLDQDINNRFREDLPQGIDTEAYAPGGQHAAPDPRNADIEGKLRYINEFQQQQQQQAQQGFQAAVSTQVNTAVDADVDFALKSLKEALPERVFLSLQGQFVKEVQGKLNANPIQLRAYRMAVDAARANPTPQNLKAAADAMRSAVRPHITQLRRQYLDDAKSLITASSAKRHQTLEEASQKTGASSVAQPVGKDLAPALSRLPGESYAESLNRRVKERVAAAS